MIPVRDALRDGATRLAAAGIDASAREARLLLAEAAGLTQADLLRDPARPIDPAPFRAMLDRRAAREPLAYIVGWQEFWSLRLEVSPATLIPRADSETLIEAARAIRPTGVNQILDLGTGTGALLLAAVSEYETAWGLGIDRSPAAASLASRNARALGFADRALMVCGDWADAIDARFDLVLSNPPYIEDGAIAGLMPEVAQFEPRLALAGGPDGLEAYRAIIGALPRLLAPGGLAVLELGEGQREPVAALASSLGRVSWRRDLAGIERALVIETT